MTLSNTPIRAKIGKMDVAALNIYQEVYVEYTLETEDIKLTVEHSMVAQQPKNSISNYALLAATWGVPDCSAATKPRGFFTICSKEAHVYEPTVCSLVGPEQTCDVDFLQARCQNVRKDSCKSPRLELNEKKKRYIYIKKVVW